MNGDRPEKLRKYIDPAESRFFYYTGKGIGVMEAGNGMRQVIVTVT